MLTKDEIQFIESLNVTPDTKQRMRIEAFLRKRIARYESCNGYCLTCNVLEDCACCYIRNLDFKELGDLIEEIVKEK